MIQVFFFNFRHQAIVHYLIPLCKLRLRQMYMGLNPTQAQTVPWHSGAIVSVECLLDEVLSRTLPGLPYNCSRSNGVSLSSHALVNRPTFISQFTTQTQIYVGYPCIHVLCRGSDRISKCNGLSSIWRYLEL